MSQIRVNTIQNANGTTGITFAANGQMSLANTPLQLTGGQIKFPGTQIASADGNTLDDYEEGTWTPTVTPASGSLTAYASSGVYVKVGRFVQVVGVFTLTTPGTASGYLVGGGLPFTAVGPSGAYRDALGTGREDGATGVFYQVVVGPSSGAFGMTTTADGPITWTTGYEYIFTMTFQTA